MSADAGLAALLVASGADVNGKNRDGKTPMHAAAASQCQEVVDLLLANGADVNATDSEGRSPLHECLRSSPFRVNLMVGLPPKPLHDSVPFVRFLLGKGASVNVSDATGETPLHLAVGSGQVEVLPLLLKGGADPNIRRPDGYAPLHLVPGGAQVLIWLERPKEAPEWAVASDRRAAEAATLLVKAGADPNLRDAFGRTALHVSATAMRVHELTDAALVAGGADPSLRDSSGKTAGEISAGGPAAFIKSRQW